VTTSSLGAVGNVHVSLRMKVIDIGLHNLKVWVARVILVISLDQNVRARPTYKETRELYCQLDHLLRKLQAYVLFCR
jgi:hypothetical protein